ncbi:hypothetical protein BM221_010708 [Beauveria bassiana]|uniref:Uncharacterized protein n=1 Tax=Beauveria bassiana TaxID=176275 RepID=A0A2N6N896_BEABA|nr:hypothetical protein BM221_010708 [Beauveria bassiana]
MTSTLLADNLAFASGLHRAGLDNSLKSSEPDSLTQGWDNSPGSSEPTRTGLDHLPGSSEPTHSGC